MVPSSSAHIAELAPPSRQGAYMGIYNVSFNLGLVLAGSLGGFIYETLSPRALWLACIAFGVASAVAASRIRKDKCTF